MAEITRGIIGVTIMAGVFLFVGWIILTVLGVCIALFDVDQL